MRKNTHLIRCKRRLMELNAAGDGWQDTGVIDAIEAYGEYCSCELCGHPRVRKLHEMEQADSQVSLKVGSQCAKLLLSGGLATFELEE